MQLEIQPDVEAQLTAEAEAHGLALDLYVVRKLTEPRFTGNSGQHSVSQAVDTIRALRKGNLLGGVKVKDLVEDGRKY